MGFTFGQSEPTGKVTKKENKQSTDVVVLNYGRVHHEYASVHKAGCRDIRRDANENMASFGGRYIDTKSALENYLDKEMCQLGYGELGWEEVIKVLPCAQDESYKVSIKEFANYIQGREEI